MYLGITGASGLIGSALVDLALRRGHEVIAFSRRPEHAVPGCEMRRYSLEAPLDFSGCEAVVHLAAETVMGVWTPAKKRRIVQTRVEGTRHVAASIRAMATPPEVFLCGSATGYYGSSGERELREDAPAGDSFLARTVKAWEAEANTVPGVRTALLRTSVVLDRKRGALPLMRTVFKAGLGAKFGDGQQWFPWIHIADIAALALFIIENTAIHGPVNAAAPWPVRNAEWTQALAKAVHRPALLWVPAPLARLGGDFSDEVLDSKKVVPAVATEHGFPFKFPDVESALQDLVS